MTSTAHLIRAIVAYDFSPSAGEALQRAVEAALRAPEHELHILTVLDNRSAVPLAHQHVTYDEADRVRERTIEAVTEAFRGRAAAAEVAFFVHSRIGNPADEILWLAEELGADMIFVGSHGKGGLERLLLGSVSERVAREARCAVVVARPKGYAEVSLMHVVPDEHPHHQYQPPHRYAYTNTSVITRPAAWPLW